MQAYVEEEESVVVVSNDSNNDNQEQEGESEVETMNYADYAVATGMYLGTE